MFNFATNLLRRSRRSDLRCVNAAASGIARYATGVAVFSPAQKPSDPVLAGQTEAGRHLFCVVIAFPDGKGYPVTAREMTDSEKQRYASWKKP